MKFQIVDKDLGPQVIPVINEMSIDADNADQAIEKVMNLMGIPLGSTYSELMGIKAVEIRDGE